MDKDIAVNLISELQKCRESIDKVELMSREILEEDFRNDFVKVLGRISLDLYSKAMGKIIQSYPDLDPYAEKND